MDNTLVIVIHVRGKEDRRRFIQRQLDAVGLSGHFILDGNVEDLTDDILDRYFTGDMHGRHPRTSCAYKHLLAMQYILDHQLEGALIVEDDLRLYRRFNDFFTRSLEECREKYTGQPFIVNYEESSLLFVPRSKRRKDTILYPAERDRYTGCMYINHNAAVVIMNYLSKHKMTTPIDFFHRELTKQGLIRYFWSHPCLACQCSCDGSMPTMIPTRPRPLKRLKWFYKRLYKHLLYALR